MFGKPEQMPWLFGAVPLVVFHTSPVFWQCPWYCPAPQSSARSGLWGLPASLASPQGRGSPEQIALGNKAHWADSVCPGEVEAHCLLFLLVFIPCLKPPLGSSSPLWSGPMGWQISPWQKDFGFHSFVTTSLPLQQSVILHFHCQP